MLKLRKAYRFSLLMTLLLLIFPILSGVVITVAKLDPLQGLLVQALGFALALLVGLLISKKRWGTTREVGLRQLQIRDLRTYFYFAPILLAELGMLLFGFRESMNLKYIAIHLLFSLVVGFCEELYFRGIILKALEPKGVHIQILISSLLFSLAHLTYLLTGVGLIVTLFQVFLAFCFGFLAAVLALSNKSLWIPIAWHALHNFLQYIRVENSGNLDYIAGSVQCVIFLAYGIYLLNTKLVDHEDQKGPNLEDQSPTMTSGR